MVRKHLAFLAALVGVGLIGGCSSTSNNCCPNERPSLWDRIRHRPQCCETGAVVGNPGAEGPVMSEGDAVVLPQPQTATAQPGPGCTGTISPPLSQPPRLAPQPQPQAQQRPYVPQ
jgi:hypothetical protein